MSRDLERPLTFHTLYDSSNVSVSDYNCRACRGGPAAEEHTDSHKIVLLRRGIFSFRPNAERLLWVSRHGTMPPALPERYADRNLRDAVCVGDIRRPNSNAHARWTCQAQKMSQFKRMSTSGASAGTQPARWRRR